MQDQESIAEMICQGNNPHQKLTGGRPEARAVWPAVLGWLLLAGLVFWGSPLTANAESLSPEALQTLRRESSRGLASAQYTLGRQYVMGTCVQRDVSRGRRLLRKAAEQKYPPAILYLARIHERGLGLSRDFVTAKGWYEKAAELGIEAAAIKLAPFRNIQPDREFTLLELPLARATPFALRYALQKRGAQPLKLMDGSSCDIFASNGLLQGSDRIRACYTDSRLLAHLEYRFPPRNGQATPSLSGILDRLTGKYGSPKLLESEGTPLEFSWKVLGVRIALRMDHPTKTAFLRYAVQTRQERYLRELEQRHEAQKPPVPEL